MKNRGNEGDQKVNGYAYRDVLIIGNGFDLYHKLPTRYTDFLFLAKNWEYFYKKYKENRTEIEQSSPRDTMPFQVALDNGKLTFKSLDDFADHAEVMDENKIYKFSTYLGNLWMKYFIEIDYDKEKWIDFETEIENVLVVIESFFSEDISQCAGRTIKAILNPQKYKIISFLIREAGCIPVTFEQIKREQINECIYGGAKERLLETLRNQLDELIEAIHIYMDEFVGYIKPLYYSEQINTLKDINILNFNYTYTYKTIYRDEHFNEWHFVHGSLADNNLVLGIPDSTFDEKIDYVYFQKYFQRIQKRTGAFYLDWIPKSIDGHLPSHQISIYIMGHSLGMTDKGILERFFTAEESVKNIYIYYHNQDSYEKLVIALIEMFDKEFVIDQTGKGRIQFVELKPEVKIDEYQ